SRNAALGKNDQTRVSLGGVFNEGFDLAKVGVLVAGQTFELHRSDRRVRLSSRSPFIRSSTAHSRRLFVHGPRFHGAISAARSDSASVRRASHAQNFTAGGQRLP